MDDGDREQRSKAPARTKAKVNGDSPAVAIVQAAIERARERLGTLAR